MRFTLLFLLPFLLLGAGCTSVSSMQTARTVSEGEYRFLVAGGLFRTDALTSGDSTPTQYPYIEGAARFGFTPGWDIGLKVTAPGMFTGDIKAELYADEAWALSVGAGVGYLAVKGQDDTYFNDDLLDVLLPLYLSYDFSDVFGLYASPRVVWRSFKKEYLLVGGAGGVRIGNSLGLYLEFSGAKDLRSDYSQFQLGAGFFFGSPHAKSAP